MNRNKPSIPHDDSPRQEVLHFWNMRSVGIEIIMAQHNTCLKVQKMLDIFKKNHEEGQSPDQSQAPQEPEVPVQVQEPQEVVEVNELPTEPKHVEETQTNAGDDLINVLSTLKQEENSLLNEKQELLNIGEQLRLRTLEEIEKTRQRISSLQTEIPDLKQKCEVMAKALEIPVYNKAD